MRKPRLRLRTVPECHPTISPKRGDAAHLPAACSAAGVWALTTATIAATTSASAGEMGSAAHGPRQTRRPTFGASIQRRKERHGVTSRSSGIRTATTGRGSSPGEDPTGSSRSPRRRARRTRARPRQRRITQSGHDGRRDGRHRRRARCSRRPRSAALTAAAATAPTQATGPVQLVERRPFTAGLGWCVCRFCGGCSRATPRCSSARRCCWCSRRRR
jgi:hypothetical protein